MLSPVQAGAAGHACGHNLLGAGSAFAAVAIRDGAMIMLNAIELLHEHVPQETRIQYFISNGGRATNIVPDLPKSNWQPGTRMQRR